MTTIDKLTEKQWAQIKVIAIDMLDQNLYGSDQTKIAIAAFISWMSKNKIQLIVDINDDIDQIH